jgi:hypothetical protein
LAWPAPGAIDGAGSNGPLLGDVVSAVGVGAVALGPAGLGGTGGELFRGSPGV